MKRKLVFPYLFLQKSLLSPLRNSRPEKLGNFPKQVKQYIFLYQRPFSQNFNNNDSTTQVFLFFKNLKNKFFRNTSESPKKIPILMSSPSSFSVVLKPQKNFYAAFYSFFCKYCLHPNNLYFRFSIQNCEDRWDRFFKFSYCNCTSTASQQGHHENDSPATLKTGLPPQLKFFQNKSLKCRLKTIC